MVQSLPQQGVLRVVPPAALEASLKADAEQKAQANQPVSPEVMSNLAGFVRGQYQIFRNHRMDAMAGWSERLLSALRTFKGNYDAQTLSEIKKFGGSEVYARITAMKCRGTTSLLRDVYLTPDKPWGISPPEDPDIPPQILQAIQSLVQSELGTLQQYGAQTDPSTIRDRVTMLMEAARDAEKKKAEERAKLAEDKIDELLDIGGFYKALAEFLVDLPLFPIACIKGPIVRVIPTVTWAGQTPMVKQTPKLTWSRISPFDVWWTPGVADIEDAAVIERTKLTRTDLNDLLDLPGYNQQNVMNVLRDYGAGGLTDDWDSTDAERAVEESRENPTLNRSGLITCLEYHGNVQGRMLLDYGMDAKNIPDAMRDYAVQCWVIGGYVIKTQFSPSPRKRHPYFITSFEKVPGTPVGNALPDILADIQSSANATLRALINNLSIASGPQVVINDDRLSDGESGEDIYPWKRWHMRSDPMGNNTEKSVDFFMPDSRAQELMTVYNYFNNLADDLSAIPKYSMGTGTTGGAGRTASGLSMLMSNASKLLQTVAANIDRDILAPCLAQLFDMILLTDKSGMLRGDENIKVMGVNVAVQRETQRSRQLEFLQITANPIDAPIMGTKGRGAVLRAVSQTLGLPGEDIVPSDDALDAMAKQQQMQAQPQPGQPQPGQPQPQPQAQAGAQAQGNQPGPSATQDMGPRLQIAGGAG